MSDLIETLQILSNLIGPSGFENPVRRTLREMVTPHVDEIRVDAMGNLITLKRSSTGASPMRVMVTAHMDEVALMVVGHTGDGELQIETIGGINAQILPGLHVLVGKEKLRGVIGLQAIHRAPDSSFDAVPDIHHLVVDIGAKNRDEAQGLAPLGTPIAFDTQFRDLGVSISGKAFDDRVGCAILKTLLQGERYPFDLYGVFTVQEEVGLRGAQVAAQALAPQIAIALEGTLADDLPKEDEKDVSSTASLGKGAAVTVMDRSYATPPRLLRHVMAAGDANGIPYQLKQPGISGTESGATHSAGCGVAAITIAVPCRYIHSPIALTRRSDVENTYRLVQASLERMTSEIITME